MKKSLLQLVSALVLTLTMAACGSKMSDEQKAQLKGFNQSVERSVQVGQKGNKLNLNGAYFDITPGPTKSEDQKLEEMLARLNSDLQSGKCNMPEPIVSNNNTSIELSYAVSGAQCPIQYSFEVKGDALSELKFSFKFKVIDPQFAELSDVTSATLNVTTKTDISDSSAKITLKGSGEVNSIAYGDVKIVYDGEFKADKTSSGANKSGKLTVKIEFKEFTAELGKAQDNEETTYTIGGETVTAEEFAEYASGFQPNTGTPKSEF